jgi:RimJ/RimL family protein N-acetyltransferase
MESEDAHPRPASLEGRLFGLRPLLPDDLGFLYALATNPTSGYRWRFRGAVPPLEVFQELLWQGVHVQFLVFDRETGAPVGHVVAYGADLHNGFAYVGLVMGPSLHGRGLAVEPLMVFNRYLFHTWNFRKLYLETSDFNFSQFASGEGRYFHTEARLKNHDYYANRYWDKLILAIYPTDTLELPGFVS